MAENANEVRAEVPVLEKKLAAALAEAAKRRDEFFRAELARVKAQQDLVALQIVMARQRALLKRRPKPDEAKAPTHPTPPDEEAIP